MPEVKVEKKPYSFDANAYYFHITIDGRTVAGITVETPAPARNRFIELCRENVEELNKLLIEAEIKREWNFANEGRGKMWPEFRNLERFKRKLLDQAGVRDS